MSKQSKAEMQRQKDERIKLMKLDAEVRLSCLGLAVKSIKGDYSEDSLIEYAHKLYMYSLSAYLPDSLIPKESDDSEDGVG
tara:strand:- start:260 stop:502 length:243 start_codon:yes stop_codon:yes gene_type:complete